MEMSWGLGFTIGPLIAGLIYDWIGYLGPFLIFTSLLAILTPILYQLMNKYFTQTTQENFNSINNDT